MRPLWIVTPSLRAITIGMNTSLGTHILLRSNLEPMRPMPMTEFGASMVGTGGSFSKDVSGRTVRAWIP